jgi:hypothetical protein
VCESVYTSYFIKHLKHIAYNIASFNTKAKATVAAQTKHMDNVTDPTNGPLSSYENVNIIPGLSTLMLH